MDKKVLIEKLKAGQEFEAKITNLLEYGAYLDIDGVKVVLNNKDFSDDNTPVYKIFNVGDTILITFKFISEHKEIIHVQVKNKYVKSKIGEI